MTQRLGALAALEEDPGLVPDTHGASPNSSCVSINLVLGDSTPSSGFHRPCTTPSPQYRAYVQINRNKINLKTQELV